MFNWILSIRFMYITREVRRINYYQWKYFSDRYEPILFFKDVDISLEILSIVFTGKTRKLVDTQNTIMTWKIYKFFFLFFFFFFFQFFHRCSFSWGRGNPEDMAATMALVEDKYDENGHEKRRSAGQILWIRGLTRLQTQVGYN